MLYFAKDFGHWTRAAERPHWKRRWLGELTGARVTILGMGRVGGMVAERCAGFGMRVGGVRRTPGDVGAWAEALSPAGLEDALAETDFLVVCLPLTEHTRGRVDAALLGRLPRGAVLIDVSRGGVVDEDALVAALETGQLGGAALDVFAQEPLLASSPLWGREDVLLTPHVAGTTPYYLERALALFLDNLRALEERGVPVTPVNVEAGY
nr:NAD(P)-dependent oxidoreductase [Halomonas getboli]